jgi:hypothetical protein
VDGPKAITDAVIHLLGKRSKVAPTGGGPPKTPTLPLPVYGLGMKDLMQEAFLNIARPKGWRYLIVTNGTIAVADVRERDDGSLKFTGMTSGPIAQRIEEAAELAEKLYKNEVKSFEPRILEIPSVYMTALWLHGETEIFIPVLDGVRKDSSIVHEDPTFLKRARDAAISRSQRIPRSQP